MSKTLTPSNLSEIIISHKESSFILNGFFVTSGVSQKSPNLYKYISVKEYTSSLRNFKSKKGSMFIGK